MIYRVTSKAVVLDSAAALRYTRTLRTRSNMKYTAITLGGLLSIPFLALGGAFLRAAFLFYPVMLLLGAAHSYPGLEWVPALGWTASFFLVALISVIVPVSTSTSTKN